MKNLYKKIEQNLKKGLCVTVKNLGNNNYCSILNHKDINGDYRISGWWSSIERSKKWSGCHRGYSKEDWDNKDLEIVEVFRPEFEPFKIGDKVRLLDSIKNTEDWKLIEDELEDMTGVIREVFLKRKGTYYSVNGWCIGHEHLAPLVEEEVEELTLSEVCKLLGKNIKIKK